MKIKLERIKRGLTQKQLGDLAKVSDCLVSKVEKNGNSREVYIVAIEKVLAIE